MSPQPLQLVHVDPTVAPADGDVPVYDAVSELYIPTAGVNGNVTAAGTLTSNQVVIGQGTKAVATLGSLGTTTTVLHGNAAGAPTFGAVVEADITLADNTTNNSSTAKHGFLKKLDNNATNFMNGQGDWATPSGSGAPADATYLVESSNGVLSNEVVTGTTYMTTAAYASRQAAAVSGRLFLPNNGFYFERDTGSAWAPWGPIFAMTPPVDGDFAWINQGGASVDTTNGGIYLQGPATAPDSLRIREKAIANTTTGVLEIAFLPALADTAAGGGMGLILRESGTAKVLIMRYNTNANGPAVFVTYGTGPTTLTTNSLNQAIQFPNTPVFQRVAISGTNYLFSISADGRHWIQVLSLAKTTPFTTAADRWGFGVNAASGNFAIGMTLLSFSEA